MGSFSATCFISNLPITCGTSIRFFALMRSPYEDGYRGLPHASWTPFSLPLQGKYNDYGSVDSYSDAPESQALFFQALRDFAVEREVGENRCHDVAVHKELSEEGWLEALWENRVTVRDPSHANLDLDYLVPLKPEEVSEGSRWLKSMYEKLPQRTLPVVTAMVRKDVWDYLITTRADNPYFKGRFDALKSMRDIASDEETAQLIAGLNAIDANVNAVSRLALSFKRRVELYLGSPVTTNVYQTMYPGNPSEITDGYVQSLLEYEKFNNAMYGHRCSWVPGTTVGDQFGEFPIHQKFHEAMAKIAALEAEEAESD